MKQLLTEFVANQWLDLAGRLGNQLGEFVDVVTRNATGHGIAGEMAVARFLNLCCVLGPNFERRPENEWALALLADERLQERVKLHQLVVRAALELTQRRADAGASSGHLQRGDDAIVELLDAAGQAADADFVGLARSACDLEAVDIRLLEVDWRREYRNVDGDWQRLPLADLTLSIRIGNANQAPPLVCVLTHAPKAIRAARLQVRLLTHAVCDQDHHPVVLHAGEHGASRWRGHAARAVSWQVHARAAPPVTNGLGVTLIEQTLPMTSLLRVEMCGLRDEGVPVGSLETHIWAYPADQWLFSLQREPGGVRQWPVVAAAAPDVPGVTQCRIERDGEPVPSLLWSKGFQDTLDRQLGTGLDRLFEAWRASTTQSAMTATASLLCGRAALTWGWREGPGGLAHEPLMRVLGDLDLVHELDVSMTGEVSMGVTQTRLRLVVQGRKGEPQRFAREQVEPDLLDAVKPAIAQWRFDFRLEFDPVAVNEGALWSTVGPCTGGVVGEAGLRPRTSGGPGWQWYARLEIEPVSVAVCIHDPLLGQTRQELSLLPALGLVDWSLG